MDTYFDSSLSNKKNILSCATRSKIDIIHFNFHNNLSRFFNKNKHSEKADSILKITPESFILKCQKNDKCERDNDLYVKENACNYNNIANDTIPFVLPGIDKIILTSRRLASRNAHEHKKNFVNKENFSNNSGVIKTPHPPRSPQIFLDCSKIIPRVTSIYINVPRQFEDERQKLKSLFRVQVNKEFDIKYRNGLSKLKKKFENLAYEKNNSHTNYKDWLNSQINDFKKKEIKAINQNKFNLYNLEFASKKRKIDNLHRLLRKNFDLADLYLRQIRNERKEIKLELASNIHQTSVNAINNHFKSQKSLLKFLMMKRRKKFDIYDECQKVKNDLANIIDATSSMVPINRKCSITFC